MNSSDESTCTYERSDGTCCPGLASENDGLCFWHDPEESKEGDDVKRRLEEWAGTGESMEGFQLRRAQLQGARLYSDQGYDLSHANLVRAQLQGAHLYHLNLRGADLLKADLSGANLNEAVLEDANLLGAELSGARLERARLGARVLQERLAREAEKRRSHEEGRRRYLEAEEVHRVLRQAYESCGHHTEAAHFFRLEMKMHRHSMPKWSVDRMWSKIVDLFCAYGESPPRVIGSAILLNLFCAVAYFAIGINGPQGLIAFDAQAGLWENAEAYSNCVYYSVVTFTTLGYGEMTPPPGILRPLAAVQAFVGAFMMAMFVAVFGKKMTRG